MIRNVKFYTKENGSSPIKEFLESLPNKLLQKVSWTIEVIESFRRVHSDYLKKLTGTDDIWEIRVQLGSDAVRLLGFFDGNDLIIVTNGFLKKTDRIPSKEIALAEERKKDYLWRKNH